MGITTASSELESKLASKRELLEVARIILLLNAHDAGCFAATEPEPVPASFAREQAIKKCQPFFEDIALVSNRIGVENNKVTPAPELLAELAKAAQSGNKDAQLALGIRFEEGRGVERDFGKARELYRLASEDSGGQELVIRRGFFGSLDSYYPDDSEPARSGREEARRRLAALSK